MTEKLEKLKFLLTEIKNSPQSAFYRNLWGNADISAFHILPVVTVEDFLKTPLSKRSYYIKGKGLVKIIRHNSGQFLIKRNLDELGGEEYGTLGKRPMVLFENSHESLEKSFWCYEQNVLPAIGESNNLAITTFLINRYKSDSFLGDCAMLEKIISIDKTAFQNVTSVNIVGSSFNLGNIQKNIPAHALNIILGLPEVGAFARTCADCFKNEHIIFHSDKNSIVEVGGRLVVTKLLRSTTPIIRYQTEIFAEPVVSKCYCNNKNESFRLL